MGVKVEQMLALSLTEEADLALDEAEMVVAFAALYDAEEWIALGRLERAPGKEDNWIEKVGKLPAYIEEVANSLHTKRGMPISRAIATAISRIKKWAVTGNPDTKAKAVKALAQWAALRAKNAARKATA